MPITPLNPIVIPEKVYTKFWVKEILISSPIPNAEATASIVLTPYNETGEYADQFVQLNISNIMQKSLDQNSNIAKAMYFILLAINDEYTN